MPFSFQPEGWTAQHAHTHAPAHARTHARSHTKHSLNSNGIFPTLRGGKILFTKHQHCNPLKLHFLSCAGERSSPNSIVSPSTNRNTHTRTHSHSSQRYFCVICNPSVSVRVSTTVYQTLALPLPHWLTTPDPFDCQPMINQCGGNTTFRHQITHPQHPSPPDATRPEPLGWSPNVQGSITTGSA